MQQPGQLFGVASQRSFIGPFLRFGSGTGPGDENRWAGSALVLTKGGAAVAAGQGKADAPVLYLYDKQSSGNGEAKEQQLTPVELDRCAGTEAVCGSFTARTQTVVRLCNTAAAWDGFSGGLSCT
jgi:hypothetical protein